MPSDSTTAEIPIHDPVLCRVPLPYHGLYYPLGFAVEIAANSPQVIAAAGDSWQGTAAAFPDRPIRLHVVVSEQGPAELPPNPAFCMQRHLYSIVSDARNFAAGDLREGFAYAFLGPAAASNAPWLRWFFLEAMTYATLDWQHFVSVHAGSVALGGHGVLLIGDSGAGKSCLSYACVRRGWTYVSDDATYLLRRSGSRTVLGRPEVMRFRESAVTLFPELRGRPVMVRGEGKPSIEVRTADFPRIRTASRMQAEHLVMLKRLPDGPAKLIPLSPADAYSRLEASIGMREADIRQEQLDALRVLTRASAWTLQYSELDEAVDVLETLMQRES